jgi:hypothetical protein
MDNQQVSPLLGLPVEILWKILDLVTSRSDRSWFVHTLGLKLTAKVFREVYPKASWDDVHLDGDGAGLVMLWIETCTNCASCGERYLEARWMLRRWQPICAKCLACCKHHQHHASRDGLKRWRKISPPDECDGDVVPTS